VCATESLLFYASKLLDDGKWFSAGEAGERGRHRRISDAVSIDWTEEDRGGQKDNRGLLKAVCVVFVNIFRFS
jgi:hypothetical protein